MVVTRVSTPALLLVYERRPDVDYGAFDQVLSEAFPDAVRLFPGALLVGRPVPDVNQLRAFLHSLLPAPGGLFVVRLTGDTAWVLPEDADSAVQDLLSSW